jgi:hypothetical protein
VIGGRGSSGAQNTNHHHHASLVVLDREDSTLGGLAMAVGISSRKSSRN